MFGRKRNNISVLELYSRIENYPLGVEVQNTEGDMARLVVCAHLMGREYGMDVQKIKQRVVEALGGMWQISKLPGLYEALDILGVSTDWYSDFSKVESWYDAHYYSILTLERLIKDLM